MKNWLRSFLGITKLENIIVDSSNRSEDILSSNKDKILNNEDKIDFTNDQLNNIYKKLSFLSNKIQVNRDENFTDETLDVIPEFKIENEVESISFESVELEEFRNHFRELYVTKEDQNMLFNTLSSVVGATSNVAIASFSTHGLFKATADPSKLMQLSSGGVGSSVTDEGGKIIKQAGFMPAGATIFAPLVIFQLTSMVTGMYYMNGINKQLQNIQNKIDELIKLYHIERQAKLIKSFKFINEYLQRKNFVLEDFVNMKAIINEIANVREDYFLMVEDSYAKIKSSNKYEALSSLKEAKKINSDFKETNIIFKLKNSLIADELYHLAKITEFHMNLCYKSPDINRINVIKDQLENIKSFEEKNICFYKTVNLFHEIKKETLQCFDKALQETWVNEKGIKDIKSNFSKTLNDFEKEKTNKINSIITSYKKTIEPFSKTGTFYIDNRDGNPKIYVD